jgi:basic membrane protein A
MTRPARRRILLAAASLAVLGACSRFRPPERGPIAALFNGRIDDGGVIEASYRGLLRVRDVFGIPIQVAEVPPDEEAMRTALRSLAESGATMVMAYGATPSAAMQRIAWEFPELRFALIQGDLTRPNLAIYAVAQEESSWLAGAAAGLLTRSNVVGHVASARTPDALKARAAYAAGLRFTNPKAQLLTHFAGAQAGAVVTHRVANAEIDAGADIVFDMLDASRGGAIEACRTRGVRMIGSVRDWVAAIPEVFVASAVADPGEAVFQAAVDLRDNIWQGELIKRFGVRHPAAVRLALADNAPEQVKTRIARATQELAAGTIKLPDDYAGVEFTV